MFKNLIASGLFLLLLVSTESFAQSSEATYPPDGVYASFSSFRNGKPDLVREQLIRSLNSSNDFSIRQWINTENLFVVDSIEEHTKYSMEKIWGYVENGTLNIHLGFKFHKVSLLGQISYFLESYPVIRGNMAPVVTEVKATAAYRLMDMETGELYEYTAENLADLLAPDDSLFKEFKAIQSPRMQRRRMYTFMEQYNKAHPLRPITNE